MSTTNSNEKTNTTQTTPKQPKAADPDGKSELPGHNTDFPTPTSTDPGPSGTTTG